MRTITRCSKCLMPSSRPRITFENGVCNACQFHERRHEVDWNARKAAFLDLVSAHRKHPVYDCVVPFSGGKDSATIAYKLKSDLGLHPLLVTYGQLLWTDVGRHNFDQVAKAGFDIIYWRVNQDVSRKLTKRFMIERGHPKNHYDAGVNACPIRTAKDMGIPLVVYAEHGESEYGGHVLSEEHRKVRDLAEVLENQVGDNPLAWARDDVTERDLYPYLYPDLADGEVTAVYYSYFFPWDIYENARVSRETLGFRQAQNGLPEVFQWGKSDGSFEGFDSIDDKIDDLDFYMMHVKFGFGRATRMASRLIQKGHMTRDEGFELVKMYDGEFPETYLADVLEYMDMTRTELMTCIGSHKNPEIWDGDKLRFE